MPDVEQTVAGPARNEATITAMAEVLAAVGSGGGIIGWADEAPVPPAPAGEPVAASGVTIGHGPIRLRDSAPPTHIGEAVAPTAPRREVVGHGTIRLRDRAVVSQPADVGAEPDPGSQEPAGHGPIRLLDPADGPERPDLTPVAVAAVLDAIDATT